MASQNKTLGKFRLTGIRRAMRGVPQIEVTFSIDTNGIVNVSARDLGTGKSQEITITASSNLSQADIDRAVREAQQSAADDARMKAEAEARNRAETLLYSAQTGLRSVDKSRRAPVEAAEKQLKKAMRGKDNGAIIAACDELERAMADAGIHPDAQPEETPGDDGYVDASFNSVDDGKE